MSHEEETDIPIFEDFEDNTDFTSKKPADSNIGGHSSFNDFSLKEDLLRSVKEAGFERPSEVQY